MPFYQNQRKNVFKKVPNLTLGKAIDIATTDEMSKAQLETMGNEDASINCVNQRKQNEDALKGKKINTLKRKNWEGGGGGGTE